jgi:hypothetical protein
LEANVTIHEIEHMWKVASNDPNHDYNWNDTVVIAFAKLVAQHEREACAEVCKKHADVYAGLEQNPTTQSAWAACIDNHDAIRARGQV